MRYPPRGDIQPYGQSLHPYQQVAMGAARQIPQGTKALQELVRQHILRKNTPKDFVKDQQGNPNMGRIHSEVEKASGRRYPEAPIRMERGKAGREGYGERHLGADKQKRAIQFGYDSATDLVRDVAENYDTVVEQINGRLMLVKRDKSGNRYAISEFQPNRDMWRLWKKPDPYYGVTTGFPEGRNNIHKPQRHNLTREIQGRDGKILWQRKK